MRPRPESITDQVTAREALAARSAVWTRHWASGAPHSCAGTYGERYTGAIAEFWRTVFGSLTGGQRVLDIATGNGALPRLLLALQPAAPIEVDAIDLAAIEPPWIASLSAAARGRMRFHGDQPAESLSFPDRAFDLIISQYGIEYSDLDCSITEMLRVLAPGGRIALLVHVVGSRPVTLAAVEIAHLDWLLSDAGLLRATAAMIEPISRAGTPDGRAALAYDRGAEVARERFNAAQLGLRERAAVKDGADVLFEMQTALAAALGVAAQHGVAAARIRLDAIELAARDSHLRLRQLCNHALPRSKLDALCQALLQAPGASRSVTTGEVHEQGFLMGCTLLAHTTASQQA